MLRQRIRFVLATLICQLAMSSCSPSSQPQEEARRQQEDKLRREVLQLATKHNADIQWMQILRGREFYTMELQEALLEPKSVPRLLLADITDVKKRQDSYVASAHDWLSDVYFQLECSEQQARYILAAATDHSRRWQQYAIVMLPDSVDKPIAQLTGEMDWDTVSLTHEAAAVFVVTGVCLDILAMGELQLDAKDLMEPRN